MSLLGLYNRNLYRSKFYAFRSKCEDCTNCTPVYWILAFALLKILLIL